MANFSLSDTPWLTEFANPIDNLAKGAQAGAAVAGVSLSKQRLAFEERQVNEQAQERAQLTPFRIAQYLQEQELNTIKIQDQYLEQKMVLENKTASMEVSARLAEGFKNDEDPTALNVILLQAQSKYPYYALSPQAKGHATALQNYQESKQRLEIAEIQAASREEVAQIRADLQAERDKNKTTANKADMESLNEMEDAYMNETDPVLKKKKQARFETFRKTVVPHGSDGRVMDLTSYIAKNLPLVLESMNTGDGKKRYAGFTDEAKRSRARKMVTDEYNTIVGDRNQAEAATEQPTSTPPSSVPQTKKFKFNPATRKLEPIQ